MDQGKKNRKRKTQTDRHTVRQTDKQTEKQKDRKTGIERIQIKRYAKD